MFFFPSFSEAFRLLQSGFDFLCAFEIAFKEKQARNLGRILQLRYGAYATYERLKIGKATEKLCSNSAAVLEWFSVAISLHRKKQVLTGSSLKRNNFVLYKSETE